MRKSIGSAAGALAFFIGGWAVPVAFPEVEPWVGQAMLIVAASLAFISIAFWLWNLVNGRDDGDGISLSGSGNVLSQIRGKVGNVTIHNAPPNPAATNPLKQAVSPRSVEAGRARTGEARRKDELAAKRAKIREEREARESLEYDMTTVDVAERVGPIVGGDGWDKSREWVEGIRLEFQDRVFNKHLKTWGRLGGSALGEIDPDDWRHATFRWWKGELYVPSQWSAGSLTYEDVRFNKSQVDQIWPEKDDGPQTTATV